MATYDWKITVVTYTLNEISILRTTMESITGYGNDYPLVSRILEDIRKSGNGCDIDAIVKDQVVKYLCTCNNCTSYKDYLKMGIDDIMYNTDISELPLYLNCSEDEYLKKVVATWRLSIGK